LIAGSVTAFFKTSGDALGCMVQYGNISSSELKEPTR
jgi:hypothetical protein